LNSGSELSRSNLQKNLEQLQKNFELIMSVYKTNLVFEKGVNDIQFSKMIFNFLMFSDTTILKNIGLKIKGFKKQQQN